MRIAVIGAGGVGGYFGARLAAAGHEVVFGARGPHRQAMATTGLTIRSATGDLHIAQPGLLDDPPNAGPWNAIFLCVKLWDLEDAARLIQPMVSLTTSVVPFQNGVEGEQAVAAILGAERVLGGVAHIAVTIAEPGVIQHTGTMAKLAYGELDGSASSRLSALHGAVSGAGIDGEASGEIGRLIWRKFVMLAPFAGATCLYRRSIGAVLAEPDSRASVEALVAETAAVGRAQGVDLDDGQEARTLQMAAGLPFEMKTSMLHDLEAGRRLELPWLNGAVVRLGRTHGIPTPENQQVVTTLDPLALGGGHDA
jgi:2-dehydropantoate 2-reductase